MAVTFEDDTIGDDRIPERSAASHRELLRHPWLRPSQDSCRACSASARTGACPLMQKPGRDAATSLTSVRDGFVVEGNDVK